MTFEAFLKKIRERIGYYCRDEYWRSAWEWSKGKTQDEIEKEIPGWAINAIGTDYAYSHG